MNVTGVVGPVGVAEGLVVVVEVAFIDCESVPVDVEVVVRVVPLPVVVWNKAGDNTRLITQRAMVNFEYQKSVRKVFVKHQLILGILGTYLV